jgi:predicted MFS family arabinose efflux permease
VWGWGNPGIWLCIIGGLVLLIIFGFLELRTRSPLIEMRIFKVRAFFVQNLVLGISGMVFVPVFFFASEYAQIALGKKANEASLYLLYFFIGFVVAAQIGGRMLDRVGAKRPVVLGCALAAVGFGLWASKMTDLSQSKQIWTVVLAGAGMGFMLGPASTDAVNHAGRLSYGEATGITQTVRNYAASLGLAILGTILVDRTHSEVTKSLISQGVPQSRALTEATHFSQSQNSSTHAGAIPHFFRVDFAYASRTVFFVMCGVMGVAALVALLGLRPGLQQDTGDAEVAAAEHGAPAP